jgi:hypothetical protein
VPIAEALGYITILLQWQSSYVPSQHLTAYRVSKALGSYDRASWAKYEERRPTRCNNYMFIINFCLNMFRTSLCASSGEQRVCYCIWCVVLVLLDVVGSGCGALCCSMRALYYSHVSTCFGHHYAHLQENKGSVTAFGVLFWFCLMWFVAVVGRCSHPTTQRPTTATNHIKQNQNNTPNAVTDPLFSWRCA